MDISYKDQKKESFKVIITKEDNDKVDKKDLEFMFTVIVIDNL